jgi:hypothetical protein
VTVPTGDPVGHLDAVAVSGGKVFAWGWAADPKQPAAPILVHLYLDGVLASFGPASLAVPTADVPAVKAAGYGLAHGFFAGAPVTPGAHRLCVYAINSASGANNPQLGCTAFRA